MPGGHPEPEELGIRSAEDWLARTAAVCGEADGGAGDLDESSVRNELFDAMLREVIEETGIPRSALSEPLCLGLSRRLRNHRPDIIFLITCSLESAAVAELYATGPSVHRDESLQLLTLERENFLRRVLDEDALPMPGCHRGGVELYRRYLAAA
eukprot:TRINITY_DN23593_c0_g1_i2.p1 TRINITY_DN23593_c0_g1~~TRINITY_DN23593_c0_g1_i2.p1  ORF type:complete len:154 (-),score=33.06 TRINITY_DN23593_c0_g1_i2:70-531(-)